MYNSISLTCTDAVLHTVLYLTELEGDYVYDVYYARGGDGHQTTDYSL